MKNIVKLIIIPCLLSTIFSQEKGNGFGFTFSAANPKIMDLMMLQEGGYSPTVYYIHLFHGIRIEPSLGYFFASYGEESPSTYSATTLGIGFSEDKNQSENFVTYWGGRFFMTMFSESTSEDVENLISISPVYGAEYSFSDNFSVGGETRINYIINDERTIANISPHLFFRFYK